jgi:hypothetical protein
MLSSQKSFKPLTIEILTSENLKGFMGSASLNFPFITFTHSCLAIRIGRSNKKSLLSPYFKGKNHRDSQDSFKTKNAKTFNFRIF